MLQGVTPVHLHKDPRQWLKVPDLNHKSSFGPDSRPVHYLVVDLPLTI